MTDNMRKLVEQSIIQRYKNGYDEVSVRGFSKRWEQCDVWHMALQEGNLTIEQYVGMLDNEELLSVMDSQANQIHR
jgi:hypothetical protein